MMTFLFAVLAVVLAWFSLPAPWRRRVFWQTVYRTAYDWRSGLQNAIEVRCGLLGWRQFGFILSPTDGFGCAFWNSRHDPLWHHNWFRSAREPMTPSVA